MKGAAYKILGDLLAKMKYSIHKYVIYNIIVYSLA